MALDCAAPCTSYVSGPSFKISSRKHHINTWRQRLEYFHTGIVALSFTSVDTEIFSEGGYFSFEAFRLGNSGVQLPFLFIAFSAVLDGISELGFAPALCGMGITDAVHLHLKLQNC